VDSIALATRTSTVIRGAQPVGLLDKAVKANLKQDADVLQEQA
jgi:hypothetical protein